MIEDTARAVLNANTSLNISLLNLRDWSSLRKSVPTDNNYRQISLNHHFRVVREPLKQRGLQQATVWEGENCREVTCLSVLTWTKGMFIDSRTRWDVTNHGFAQIERCFLKHMELWLVWSFRRDILRNLKIFKHTAYFPLKISATLWSYLEQESEWVSKGSLKRRAECLAISEGWELHFKQHKETGQINFILVYPEYHFNTWSM